MVPCAIQVLEHHTVFKPFQMLSGAVWLFLSKMTNSQWVELGFV